MADTNCTKGLGHSRHVSDKFSHRNRRLEAHVLRFTCFCWLNILVSLEKIHCSHAHCMQQTPQSLKTSAFSLDSIPTFWACALIVYIIVRYPAQLWVQWSEDFNCSRYNVRSNGLFSCHQQQLLVVIDLCWPFLCVFHHGHFYQIIDIKIIFWQFYDFAVICGRSPVPCFRPSLYKYIESWRYTNCFCSGDNVLLLWCYEGYAHLFLRARK